MFILKKKYFLLIESIKDINLKNIKIRNKFFIIYRKKNKNDQLQDLAMFRKECEQKGIKFYVANDLKLAILLYSDGIYLSSYNKDLKFLNYKKKNFDIIGSAHNFREISTKIKQGCNSILFSKLFLVDYDKKSPILGVIKFNRYSKIYSQLIPLGGIKCNNLQQLNIVYSQGLALLSEIKKKPTKIISRLF